MEFFEKVLKAAINDLNTHRKDEGISMEEDLRLRIANIEAQQKIIAALEPQRRQKIKRRFKKSAGRKYRKRKLRPQPHGAGINLLHRKNRHKRRAGAFKKSLRIFSHHTR